MPTETDLTGLGMPPGLAGELGNQSYSITATGTTLAGAATLYTKNVQINSQSSQTGVVPTTTAKVGSPFWLQTQQGAGASAVIYVQSGHTLNGTVNGTTTLAAGKTCVLFQFSLKQWGTIPAVP